MVRWTLAPLYLSTAAPPNDSAEEEVMGSPLESQSVHEAATSAGNDAGGGKGKGGVSGDSGHGARRRR